MIIVGNSKHVFFLSSFAYKQLQDLVDILGVDYACFLRTTSTKHIEAAQEFWVFLQ